MTKVGIELLGQLKKNLVRVFWWILEAGDKVNLVEEVKLMELDQSRAEL